MSALLVWVQRRVVGGDVYVLATTAYHARLRVTSLTGIRKPNVEGVEDADVRRFRCGEVGIDVALVPGVDAFLACVTTQGRRHFVDVDEVGARIVASDFVEAARSAVQVLVDADDIDEGRLLWERIGDGDRALITRAP